MCGLSIQEKREYINNLCTTYSCNGVCIKDDGEKCPLYLYDSHTINNFLDSCECSEQEDEVIEELYNRLFSNTTVNHPAHYNRENSMECIDEMITVFGVEAVKHFCLCNVWKYRYRASDKNGIEDLKKSDWYMNKYIELLKGEHHE